MHKHMYPQAQDDNTANNDPIIELTDIVGQDQPQAPKAHDDAVFETLKAPQAINRAYLAPPYPDLLDTVPPYAQGDASQASSPYTAQATPASINDPAMFVEQNEIIHTLTDIAGQEFPPAPNSAYSDKEAVCQPDSDVAKQAASPCLASAPHDDDLNGQMQRDICTLKSSLAAMQLRLAAQEACIASLEAKLMAMEMLESHSISTQTETPHTTQQTSNAPDGHTLEHSLHDKLEKIAATVAARTVREEIQDFLIAMQKG